MGLGELNAVQENSGRTHALLDRQPPQPDFSPARSQPPWARESGLKAVNAAARGERPRTPDSWPKSLSAIIQKSWAHAGADRLRFAAVIEALSAYHLSAFGYAYDEERATRANFEGTSRVGPGGGAAVQCSCVLC